jgi:hypothetical protein
MALAACACDRDRAALTTAQYGSSDAGYGMPNPMPGSPFADGGLAPVRPIMPSPPPSAPAPTGTPTVPGRSSPTNPTPPSPTTP